MHDSSTHDETRDFDENTPHLGARESVQQPLRIGRYRVMQVLGRGGYGLVYLAQDEQLQRLVTIKVPHASLISQPEDAEAYLAEARTVANLDHPHIVPVFDLGSTQDCPCYIVSKYIEGTDLATRLKERRMGYRKAAELVETVAGALHYAHKQGLVHRDVKPGNVLIAQDGTPYVVDFGLALREENVGKGPKYAGTPAYMSPEQARGEGHRVDGRSDIFSLGVVFYELLSGRRPFRGDTKEDLFEQVTSYEAKPLRQYDEKVPKELERICRKAMAKRASERYPSAYDMAEDLRLFLQEQTAVQGETLLESGDASGADSALSSAFSSSDSSAGSSRSPSSSHRQNADLGSAHKVIPKGLRAFDSHDASFFLKLLPGPTDRNGLPESVRFWVARIDSELNENSFDIGVIYGPSGCGKSSLVKAGLLPHLSDSIHAICVESTPNDTERRLLNALRNRFPGVGQDLSLSETVSALRRGAGHKPGTKILIILDQFEQWLAANHQVENAELTKTLRHCDGVQTQCLLLVRDDFWLNLSRFLRELEVRLMEGQNCLCIDLLYPEHARNVLLAFGQAYGRLPDDVEKITAEQWGFLDEAIKGLTQSDKVICVRLALFAEMMRARPWVPDTLRTVGGAEGLGVSFLEETFDARTSLPENRYHQAAARAVLARLVPGPGQDIRGEMKDAAELLEASGYAQRPDDFEDLMRILDQQLRLLSPTSPDSVEPTVISQGGSEQDKQERRFYQLTHDYLVHSLRDWLTKGQKQTRRGRAELKLAELAALWRVSRESRYMPTWWEYAEIRLRTEPKRWNSTERELLHLCGKRYWNRFLQLACVFCLLVAGAIAGVFAASSSRLDHEAKRLVETLLVAETNELPSILLELDNYSRWAEDDLLQEYQNLPDASQAKLHVALGLLALDDRVLPFLQQRLLETPPEDFAAVRDLLFSRRERVAAACIEAGQDTNRESAARFRAACVLATYAPDHALWSDSQFCEFVSAYLVRQSPAAAIVWKEMLRPKRQSLLGPLRQIYLGDDGDLTGYMVTEILADYQRESPAALFELLMRARPRQFGVLADALTAHPDSAVQLAERTLASAYSTAGDTSSPEQNAMRIQQQVNAAILLLRFKRPDAVWPLLRHSEIPTVRANIVNMASRLGVEPYVFLERFDNEPDVSCQRAILQAIGCYSPQQIEERSRFAFQEKILKVFKTASDAGLHASAFWTLQRWGLQAEAEGIEQTLRQKESDLQSALETEKQWYVNSLGQTFVILDATSFQMGSPIGESGRRPNETSHPRELNRRLAVASTEVTKAQWRVFQTSSSSYVWSPDQPRLDAYFRTEDSPFGGMTWFQAVQFCNWLSEHEGIDKSQWCYEPIMGGYRPGMRAKENVLELTGYRLPTEAEWEFACRSATVTSRFFGESDSLLDQYAWYLENSDDHTWPVRKLKPNDWGLFDMYGNAYEWCHSIESAYDRQGKKMLDQAAGGELLEKPRRILRGGSFTHPAPYLRSADRNMNPPVDQNYRMAFGFRPVRTLRPRSDY